MRPTVERMSLVREIRLIFASWTVPAMTTVERTTPGPTTTFTTTPRMTRHGRDTQASAARGWRTWALQGFALAAVALGTQALAASSPIRSDVRMILPSEGLLAGLGDGLRRGYGLAMEQAAACGVKPPSLQLGWLPPGADPLKPVTAAPRSSLLVAPPAAPVQAYGLLADQQHLSVLLPLQRGRSLEALPQLRGSDRLWPLVPGRSLEADRLAQALLDDNIRRVMMVRDLSAESKALSDRFVASFANGNGQVIGAAPEPIAMGMNDPTAIKQLVSAGGDHPAGQSPRPGRAPGPLAGDAADRLALPREPTATPAADRCGSPQSRARLDRLRRAVRPALGLRAGAGGERRL